MRTLILLSMAMATGLAVSASANTVTIANTTDTVAYLSGSGGGPTDYYDNGTSAVGSTPIGGSEFATSQLAVTTTQVAGGNYVVDFQYTTLFSGSETLNGSTVYYPDIFLRSNSAGYSAAPFNYAISLGDETANGGLAAGLYSTSSYLTSQQVWSGRPGFIYGGQYTNTTAYQPGQAGYAGYDAPTVLTGGTKLADASVTQGQQGGSYTVDAAITLTAAELAMLPGAVDVFWGTGDCANGSFLATAVPLTGNVPVPEPATLALVAAGLLALAGLRRGVGRAI